CALTRSSSPGGARGSPIEEIAGWNGLARALEQVRDVMETFGVAQPADAPCEGERPVLALTAEYVRRHGSGGMHGFGRRGRAQEVVEGLGDGAHVARPGGHRVALEHDEAGSGYAPRQLDGALHGDPGDPPAASRAAATAA